MFLIMVYFCVKTEWLSADQASLFQASSSYLPIVLVLFGRQVHQVHQVIALEILKYSRYMATTSSAYWKMFNSDTIITVRRGVKQFGGFMFICFRYLG